MARLLVERHSVYGDEDDLFEAVGLAAEALAVPWGDGSVDGMVLEMLSQELLLAALLRRPDTAEAGVRAAAILLEAAGGDGDGTLLLLGNVASLYLREGRFTDLRAMLDVYLAVDGLPQAFAEDLTRCVVTRMENVGVEQFLADPLLTRNELTGLIGLFAATIGGWAGAPTDVGFLAMRLSQFVQVWATGDPPLSAVEHDAVVRLLEPLLDAVVGEPAMLLAHMTATRCLEAFEREPSEVRRAVMLRHAYSLLSRWPDGLNMAFVPATALLTSHRTSGDLSELETATSLFESMVGRSGQASPYVKVSLAEALALHPGRTADTVQHAVRLLASVDHARTSPIRLAQVTDAVVRAVTGLPDPSAELLRLAGELCERSWRVASDDGFITLMDRADDVVRAADDPGARFRAVRDKFARADDTAALEEEVVREFAGLSPAVAATVRTGFLDGDLAGARTAVAVLRATGPDDPRATWLLGQALMIRYRAVGALQDAVDAADALERALAGITGPAVRCVVLDALAGVLGVLFDRTGRAELLDRAVDMMREAVALAFPAVLPTLLHNLGDKLKTRFEARGSRTDLVEIVGLAERSLVLLDDVDDPEERFHAANALAGGLRYLHTVDQDPALLDRAVEAMRDAVGALPDGHPSLPSALHNLAGCLHDLELAAPGGTSPSETVDLYRRAVGLTPPGRPELAGRLITLARALAHRAATDEAEPFDREEAVELLRARLAEYGPHERNRFEAALTLGGLVADDEAVTLYREIVASDAAGPDARLRAVLRWADRAADDALPAWEAFATLLNEVASGDLPRDDRERLLSWYQSDVAEAGALALAVAGPEAALDLLERSRSLLWNRPPEGDAATWRELPSLLGDDVAVVVNAARGRGDAIVVDRDGVCVTALPGFDGPTATDLARALLSAVELADEGVGGYVTAQETAGGVLSRMWGFVAELLADLAGRRVVWCPIGVAALLPWHAAGSPDGSGALDLVTSSHTPSLRALAQARRAGGLAMERIDRLLTVAVGDRRGDPVLDHVSVEVETIMELLPDTEHTILPNLRATREAVTTELERHRFVHFACHAMQNAREPSRGGVVLADGVLGVLEMAGHGELAFMSACGTASGTIHLLNEAITPAHGLFLNGFRQVIGTLWPITDEQAAAVAREFYQRLAIGMDAAKAIGEATSTIRREHPFEPLLWASHVHIGG
ncbi:CHAT domain-containing protein [Streptomyces sp. NPDC015684]|uniref:CHAT domain-containing protein n=1 Tax=Streptomyces sp. NPDC015684 TaxID=3364963 RepID=UPI0036FF7177